MVNIDEADKTVAEIYSAQFSKEITAIALGKMLNKGILKTALAVSYRLTGKTVFKSIWKVIPIIGGVVSGGITLFTFSPMCNNLKARLHKSTETVTKELSERVLR
jgi:predicted transcriptional regulator